MKLTSSGLTHVGMKRSHNEDCLRIYRDENLFIVADGMGGHASGEVASEMSAETLAAFYRATSVDEELTWPYKYEYGQSYEENRIRVGIQLSNQRIYQSAVYDTKLKGMGTTMVATAFYGDQCSIGHVGDSRVYLFREGKIIQLTEDHSLLNDYIKMRPGGMTAEEIEAFPHKNVIVRALGMKEHVQVDVITSPLQEGDLILLCSDGLSGMLSDKEMNDLVNTHISQSKTINGVNLDQLCADLIEEGNMNGGNDNITVLIVRCDQMSDAERVQESQQNLTPQWVQKQIMSPSKTSKYTKVDPQNITKRDSIEHAPNQSTLDREIDEIIADEDESHVLEPNPVLESMQIPIQEEIPEELFAKTIKVIPPKVDPKADPKADLDLNVDLATARINKTDQSTQDQSASNQNEIESNVSMNQVKMRELPTLGKIQETSLDGLVTDQTIKMMPEDMDHGE